MGFRPRLSRRRPLFDLIAVLGLLRAMLPPAMKGAKVMTKGGLVSALSTESGLKRVQVGKLVNGLQTIAAGELKKFGKFTFPGVCMVKTRKKSASKAGKREIFGKVVLVKAKPAKTLVKARPVAALKKLSLLFRKCPHRRCYPRRG